MERAEREFRKWLCTDAVLCPEPIRTVAVAVKKRPDTSQMGRKGQGPEKTGLPYFLKAAVHCNALSALTRPTPRPPPPPSGPVHTFPEEM